jgi:hypothetical protein
MLVAAAAALAGCGLLLGEAGVTNVASSSCAEISGGACMEQTAVIAARQ